MRRAALLGVAILAAFAAGAAEPPPDPFPAAAASYLVAIDGRVIWARAPDAPRPPASLAKIMTALLVLERDAKGEAEVRVSAAAARETGSRIGLMAGERMTVRDLLTSMLVRSANDACAALAEHVSGTRGAFVEAMNARARALGLAATRFEDPCGHDRPGQASSALDLLRLVETALAIPEFSRIVALERATVATATGRKIALESSNKLLGSCAGAAGVKTGFTEKAGKCLVALVERDGHRVLVVLLDAPDRWWTAASLVEKAFGAIRGGP